MMMLQMVHDKDEDKYDDNEDHYYDDHDPRHQCLVIIIIMVLNFQGKSLRVTVEQLHKLRGWHT